MFSIYISLVGGVNPTDTLDRQSENAELTLDEFEKLVKENVRRVYRKIGNIYVAQETVEKAILGFVTALRRNPAHMNPKALFAEIVNCRLKDWCREQDRRKKRGFKETSVSDIFAIVPDKQQQCVDSPAKIAEQFETVEIVRRVISEQLDDEEKAIYRMNYIEKLKHAEIGEILGLRANTVSKKLERIHKKLEPFLSDCWEK